MFLLSPPVALARPTASRPTPALDACRQTVFAGLASDCNLSGGGSEPACCATLRDAERRRCFCAQELVDVVAAVIGEEGLDFFRQFARARCSTRLTEREACLRAPASDALFATQVGLVPPAADYADYASDASDSSDDANPEPRTPPGFPTAPVRLDAAPQTVPSYAAPAGGVPAEPPPSVAVLLDTFVRPSPPPPPRDVPRERRAPPRSSSSRRPRRSAPPNSRRRRRRESGGGEGSPVCPRWRRRCPRRDASATPDFSRTRSKPRACSDCSMGPARSPSSCPRTERGTPRS